MTISGKSLSISFNQSKQKINLTHNQRKEKYPKKNIDLARAKYNNHIIAKNPREEYEVIFGEARKEYNAKQKVRSRRIDDYYTKVNGYENREVYNEVIIGLGRQEDWENATSDEWQEGLDVVNEFVENFMENNETMHILSADVHGDEDSPHAHLVYVPVGTGYKQGLSKQTSLTKAFEGMGYKKESDFTDWRDDNLERFTEIVEDYGIERKIVGTRGFETVEDYVESTEAIDQYENEAIERIAKQQAILERQQLQFKKEKEAAEAKLKKAKIIATINKKNNTALKDKEIRLNEFEDFMNSKDEHLVNEEKRLRNIVKKINERPARESELSKRLLFVSKNSRGTDFQKEKFETYLKTGEIIHNHALPREINEQIDIGDITSTMPDVPEDDGFDR